MGFVIYLTEVFDRYRGVLLCRCKARVPQQLLNFSQIGPHVEEVRRVAMTKPVRMNSFGNPDLHRSLLENPSHIAVPKASHLGIPARTNGNKQGFGKYPRTLSRFDPDFKRLASESRKRNHPLLATLSEYSQLAPSTIHITNVEGHKFSHPNPGPVEHLDHRSISQAPQARQRAVRFHR